MVYSLDCGHVHSMLLTVGCTLMAKKILKIGNTK